MGISFGGLFGGGNQDTSSSNSTTNTDTSQRNALTTQSGNAVYGGGNTINDASLVTLGIQNNNLAGGILSHINDTNTALIAKLADVVKTTSNDAVLNTASAANSIKTAGLVTAQAGANASAATSSASDLVSKLGTSIQNYAAVAAAIFGAYYLFKKGKA